MNFLKSYLLKSRFLSDFTFAVIPFSLVWIIDRYSKNWAEDLESSLSFSIFKIELVHNYGIMLGWLSHVPDNIKTTILATLGAIIFSSYLLVIAVAPLHSKSLRIGLSLLAGGIIGNVTDRLVGFAVVDFLSVSTNGFNSPVYNLADIFQWFGYLMIAYGIYEDSVHWWPTQDFRNRTLIKASFQIRTGLLIGSVNFLVGFIFLVFGFAFFKQDSGNDFMLYYFICGFILLTFITLAGIIIGVILSHRVAGPIYALEKFLQETLDGKQRPFKLRKKDEFKELENICTKLNTEVTSRRQE